MVFTIGTTHMFPEAVKEKLEEYNIRTVLLMDGIVDNKVVKVNRTIFLL